MKLKDKWKAFVSKFQDEAMKMADEYDSKEDEKKDDAKDAPKEDKLGNGLTTYDELVKICDDLSKKIEAMGKSKDEEKKEEPKKEDMKDDKEEEKEESKDDDASSMEDRLKALEAAVQKLLEAKSGDEDSEEESEDDDMEENTMTGDTASRVEILAPGLKADVKDIKSKALKSAYATKEGKKIIDSLTGGKPTFDSADKVETLFVAASELLKLERTSELSRTKQNSSTRDGAASSGFVSAEEMNERNAKFYKQA